MTRSTIYEKSTSCCCCIFYIIRTYSRYHVARHPAIMPAAAVCTYGVTLAYIVQLTMFRVWWCDKRIGVGIAIELYSSSLVHVVGTCRLRLVYTIAYMYFYACEKYLSSPHFLFYSPLTSTSIRPRAAREHPSGDYHERFRRKRGRAELTLQYRRQTASPTRILLPKKIHDWRDERTPPVRRDQEKVTQTRRTLYTTQRTYMRFTSELQAT